MLDNLYAELSAWKEQGDHIILGMDANDDVSQSPIHSFFHLLGMKEAILSKNKHISPPATYNRNYNHKPINRLWCLAGLHI